MKITKEQLNKLADGLDPKFIFGDYELESLIVALATGVQEAYRQCMWYQDRCDELEQEAN